MVSSGLRHSRSTGLLELVNFGPAHAVRGDRGFVKARRGYSRTAPFVLPCWQDTEGVVLAIAAVIVFAFLGTSAVQRTGPFADAPEVVRTVNVRVAPGDTLWSLSRSYEPAGLTFEQRLEQIRALNPGLNTSALLRPGTRIVLPAAPTSVK